MNISFLHALGDLAAPDERERVGVQDDVHVSHVRDLHAVNRNHLAAVHPEQREKQRREHEWGASDGPS